MIGAVLGRILRWSVGVESYRAGCVIALALGAYLFSMRACSCYYLICFVWVAPCACCFLFLHVLVLVCTLLPCAFLILKYEGDECVEIQV